MELFVYSLLHPLASTQGSRYHKVQGAAHQGKAAWRSRFSLDKHPAEAYERKSPRYRLSAHFNWICTDCPFPFLKAHFQSFSCSASLTKWLIVTKRAPSEHQVTGTDKSSKPNSTTEFRGTTSGALLPWCSDQVLLTQTESNELRQSANAGSTAPAEGANPSINAFCSAFCKPNPSLPLHAITVLDPSSSPLTNQRQTRRCNQSSRQTSGEGKCSAFPLSVVSCHQSIKNSTAVFWVPPFSSLLHPSPSTRILQSESLIFSL